MNRRFPRNAPPGTPADWYERPVCGSRHRTAIGRRSLFLLGLVAGLALSLLAHLA